MRTLQLKDVANVALKKCNDEYYFFGEDGVYRKVIEKDAVEILSNVHSRKDGTTYLYLPTYVFGFIIGSINRALNGFPLGATFEQFLPKFYEEQSYRHPKPEGLDRFITKIGKPIFERKPENPKNDTFDYIFVDVFVVSQWESDIRKYIKAHREEIFKRALAKIEEPIKR